MAFLLRCPSSLERPPHASCVLHWSVLLVVRVSFYFQFFRRLKTKPEETISLTRQDAVKQILHAFINRWVFSLLLIPTGCQLLLLFFFLVFGVRGSAKQMMGGVRSPT